MGYDLYRMLRAGMPPEWTQGERLVALIIADSCNDRTGLGYISNQQLCTETGYTPVGLRRVFQRLSERGYEMRVSHGVGSDGRQVFAARGHATDYQVPVLKPRSTYRLCASEQGDTTVPPTEKGDTPVPEGDTPVPLRRYSGTAPTPVHPPNPNNHYSPVVTTSVEDARASASGGAPRQPIEAEAWAAVHSGVGA